MSTHGKFKEQLSHFKEDMIAKHQQKTWGTEIEIETEIGDREWYDSSKEKAYLKWLHFFQQPDPRLFNGHLVHQAVNWKEGKITSLIIVIDTCIHQDINRKSKSTVCASDIILHYC